MTALLEIYKCACDVRTCLQANSVVKAYLHGKPEKMLTKLASADTVVVHALEPPVPLQFIYSKDLHDQSKKSLWSLGFLLV